jgi:predicted deacylase
MELFDLDSLQPGTKGYYSLPVMNMPNGNELALTVMVAIGKHPGKTLTVLAGVHGDEYEGIRAIPEVFKQVDVEELHGRLIMVPICNAPAYFSATRNSPIDGLNLARTFPGNPEGSVTERIAHVLMHKIIAPADLLLDHHSAGTVSEMASLVGYPHQDTPLGEAARAAAIAFGGDVIWAHPTETPPGRTVSAAESLGIPWLYTEASGGSRPRPQDIEMYINGTLNVMRHMGMIHSEPQRRELQHYLIGQGDTDLPMHVKNSGYYHTFFNLLDYVEQGQVIGVVYNEVGDILEEVRAPSTGRIVLQRARPMVMAGEGVGMITGELK